MVIMNGLSILHGGACYKFFLLCQHYAQCFVMSNMLKIMHNRCKPTHSTILTNISQASLFTLVKGLQCNDVA